MNEMPQLFDGWLTADRVVMLYYIFNCTVQSMPTPDSNSSAIYVFVFKMIHLLAGNINMTRKVIPSK